jgi:hypothetical protein
VIGTLISDHIQGGVWSLGQHIIGELIEEETSSFPTVPGPDEKDRRGRRLGTGEKKIEVHAVVDKMGDVVNVGCVRAYRRRNSGCSVGQLLQGVNEVLF